MKKGKLPSVTLSEPLMAEMRRMMTEADKCIEAYRHRQPLNSEIGVGGADFDYFLKAEVIYELLRFVRLGRVPEEAGSLAKEHGRLCVDNWNAKESRRRVTLSKEGSGTLQRWNGAADAFIEGLVRRLNRANNE